MIVKQLFEESIAQSAYLVGCAAAGQAIVIDPTIDIQQYIDAAAREGLRIAAVTETHIHADFVSGARALSQATGATLYVSGEGGPEWQYAFTNEPGVRLLHDGDRIQVGAVRLDVVHTPGHTPEHLTFVVSDGSASGVPLGAFTGDFLFVGDVGRPDLLETAAGQAGTMEGSARRLFRSFGRLDALPDHLVVWPGHGSGSACGKSLGGVPVSSLGYERVVNWALLERNEEAFVNAVLRDQPDPPLYFGEMKRVNKSGMPAVPAQPALEPVDAAAVKSAIDQRVLIVDVRNDAARGYLPGSIAVPLGRSFSAWAGSAVPSGTPFMIAAADASEAAAARRALSLIGRPEAYAWIPPVAIQMYAAAGGRLETVETTDDLRGARTVIDVRTTAEWNAGHVDGALHVPLARLPEKIDRLDRSAPVIVYCQAGVRSAIAATALRRLGFARVTSLAGGYSAWREKRSDTISASAG